MSVPSAPATKALADGLATVGGYVKTSKYKFADWNLKAPSPTTKLPDSEFIKLSRAAQFFREGHFTTEDIKKVQDTAKEAKTKVKETEKLAKESKNLWDKFLSKVKGGGNLDKASQAGGTVAKSAATLLSLAPLLAALAAIGLSVAVNKVQGWRNDINEEGQQKLSDSISKVLGLMNAQKQRIDRANEGVKKAELENQRVKDRVYSLEKQQPTIRESAADAKKKANDALYEVREGRKAVEAKITTADKKANDALYEVREGRKAVEAKITTADKKANDALYETRTGRAKLEAEIATIKKPGSTPIQEIAEIKTRVVIVENRLKTVEATKSSFDQKVLQTTENTIKTTATEVNNLAKKFADSITRLAKLEALPPEVVAIKTRLQTVETEHPKKWGITVTQAEVRQATITKSTDSATRTYVDRKFATVTESQFSATEWVGRYGAKTANLVDNGADALRKTDEVLANGLSNLANNVNERIGTIERRGIPIDPEVGRLSKDIANLKNEVGKTTNDLNENKNKLIETNKDLDKLKIQTKEQDKVNTESNSKLDRILGFLPLIPGRAADAIRPDIPTIPQIETASATGTCRTLQPGGCGSKALDGLGNGINQNTNNQTNNLFNKLNTGANAAQLTLLNLINSKLGAQLPGGLSATFGRLWQMLQVDRILNILTYIAVVHNAMMLSNNIFQTLFSVVDNISQSVGFKWTNEKGEESGFGSLINEWTGNFIKSIFGEETFKNISKVWNAANRIYQAAANIASLVQSIQQSILTALEVIGGGVARLANGLRAAGQVFDKAYEWMNPNPNFDNALFRTLGKIQEVASNIETVSQTPLTIKSAVESIKEEKKAMGEALKDGEAGLKGLGIIESENKVKKADKRKEESAGKNLENVDKIEGEKNDPTP